MKKKQKTNIQNVLIDCQGLNFNTLYWYLSNFLFFKLPEPKGHMRYCHHLGSVHSLHCQYVGIIFCKLFTLRSLNQNHWANWNESLWECSLNVIWSSRKCMFLFQWEFQDGFHSTCRHKSSAYKGVF
jgi:hypothetical protein